MPLFFFALSLALYLSLSGSLYPSLYLCLCLCLSFSLVLLEITGETTCGQLLLLWYVSQHRHYSITPNKPVLEIGCPQSNQRQQVGTDCRDCYYSTGLRSAWRLPGGGLWSITIRWMRLCMRSLRPSSRT